MKPLEGERRLVARFKAGDPSAFDAIMGHYEPYVLGLARRMTGDRAAAEDICQEVFLKVLKGLRGFKGKSGLKTWIFRVAHNAVVDHARSRRPPSLSLEEMKKEGLEPVETGRSAPESLEESRLREVLEKAMATLKPTAREILHLFYWSELSVAEVARALRLPEGTVKTHLFRGRRALRERVLEATLEGSP